MFSNLLYAFNLLQSVTKLILNCGPHMTYFDLMWAGPVKLQSLTVYLICGMNSYKKNKKCNFNVSVCLHGKEMLL